MIVMIIILMMIRNLTIVGKGFQEIRNTSLCARVRVRFKTHVKFHPILHQNEATSTPHSHGIGIQTYRMNKPTRHNRNYYIDCSTSIHSTTGPKLLLLHL